MINEYGSLIWQKLPEASSGFFAGISESCLLDFALLFDIYTLGVAYPHHR
jgi:hypothetical protein